MAGGIIGRIESSRCRGRGPTKRVRSDFADQPADAAKCLAAQRLWLRVCSGLSRSLDWALHREDGSLIGGTPPLPF